MFKNLENFNIEPISDNAISLVFSFDDNFAKYFSTALQSLIENSTKDEIYDIIVFYSKLNEQNKEILLSQLKPNFNLRFFNIDSFCSKDFQKEYFKSKNWWSAETYYRLFIPFIMKSYKRVLYCDSDIVFDKNISSLYFQDFENKEIIAIRDTGLNNSNNILRADFLKNKLGIECIDDYFNAGIILYNVQNININDYTKNAKEALSIPTLQYLDQDVLNMIFNKKVKHVSMKFNLTTGVFTQKDRLAELYKDDFKESVKNPVIIHYTNRRKPWLYPEVDFAYKFWKYAKNSPYFANIVYDNISATQAMLNNKNKIFFNYRLYKVLYSLKLEKIFKNLRDSRLKYKFLTRQIEKIEKQNSKILGI